MSTTWDDLGMVNSTYQYDGNADGNAAQHLQGRGEFINKAISMSGNVAVVVVSAKLSVVFGGQVILALLLGVLSR